MIIVWRECGGGRTSVALPWRGVRKADGAAAGMDEVGVRLTDSTENFWQTTLETGRGSCSQENV